MRFEIFRGEVWLLDLSPTIGREQSGKRPALVISENIFNNGPADLIIVIPITSQDKKIRSQIRIPAGEANLTLDSFAKCEDIRSVSRQRFIRRFGLVESSTLANVEETLRFLMGI